MSTSSEGAPRARDTLVPGTRIGRWRVVEPLGAGGQGAVYRVEDPERPGVFFALKLASPAHAGRAERELELMRHRAVHPLVVGFHECLRWTSPHGVCLGFVMDWVPGQSLDVWAESEGTTFRRLAHVGASVALTLEALHARGVLHRDLKPEHIRVRASDGQPVLLDFGAGWFPGAAPLTPGPLPPTTRYLLSPEAVRSLWRGAERPGARHAFQPTEDLYALGVCLYRATTGHYPFSEWWPADVLQSALVHARPRAPQHVNPRVPRALSDLIVRLLAKEPRARFSSGAALHAALSTMEREGGPEWDTSLFAWEECTPAGGHHERQIIRPQRPQVSVSSTPPAPERPSRRGRVTRWLPRAAAVLLLLLPGARAPSFLPGVRETAAEWTTEAGSSPAAASEQAPSPVRNQKRAPCTEGLEVELSGACWLRLWQQPPNCPRQTVAYKDQCLLPVAKPPSLPTSVEGGAAKSP